MYVKVPIERTNPFLSRFGKVSKGLLLEDIFIFMEEIKKEEKRKKGFRFGIRFFLMIVILLGIVLGILYICGMSTGKSLGTVRESNKTFSLESSDIPPAVKIFEGHYFSLSLPEIYSEKRHLFSEDKKANTLEQTFFSQEGESGRKLAVTVERMPVGGISELSSYQFREMHPDEYERGVTILNGEEIISYTKKNVVYEVTGYVTQGLFVASISVTSAVEAPENLMEDFSSIVGSFQWRE